MLSFMKPSCPRTTWPGASGVLETRIGFASVAVTVVSPLRFASPSTEPFHGHATAAARGQRRTVVSPGGNRFARDPRATTQSATTRALLNIGHLHSLMLPMLVCHRANRNGSQRARLHKKRVFVSAIMGLASKNRRRGKLRSKMVTLGKRRKRAARTAGASVRSEKRLPARVVVSRVPAASPPTKRTIAAPTECRVDQGRTTLLQVCRRRQRGSRSVREAWKRRTRRPMPSRRPTAPTAWMLRGLPSLAPAAFRASSLGALRDQAALLLRQRGKQVQHERIRVPAGFGDDARSEQAPSSFETPSSLKR